MQVLLVIALETAIYLYDGMPRHEVLNHNNSLPFSELIKEAVKLLNKKGRLSVILPVIPAKEFIKLAKTEGLNLIRSTKVKPKFSKNPNLILMEFSKENTIQKNEYLIVYNEDGSDYSEMYKKLTCNFYLNFLMSQK